MYKLTRYCIVYGWAIFSVGEMVNIRTGQYRQKSLRDGWTWQPLPFWPRPDISHRPFKNENKKERKTYYIV